MTKGRNIGRAQGQKDCRTVKRKDGCTGGQKDTIYSLRSKSYKAKLKRTDEQQDEMSQGQEYDRADGREDERTESSKITLERLIGLHDV